MTLHLHIDRIVLDGLGPLDGDAVAAAAQAELARLFTEAGAPGSGGDRHERRVDGGAFPLAPGATAGGVGRHVARRVFSSLNP